MNLIKKSNIELIIFDCDGTLVDTEPLTNKILTDTINGYGIKMSYEECHKKFTGTNLNDVITFLQDQNIEISPSIFEKEYRELSRISFQKGLKVIEGAYALLDSLTIPFCIASNGPKEKMKISLGITHLDKYFPANNIFSAYDINKWKPEPDLFIHAAQAMGIEQSSCLVVEDTIHGVHAALDAGMQVVSVNPISQKQEIMNLGVPIFNNLIEIKNQIFDQNYFLSSNIS